MPLGQLTIGKDGSHFKIGSGQTNDGRFVELTGDGRRQGQQFGQFQEFGILFLASGAGGILGFLFHYTRPAENGAPGSNAEPNAFTAK